MVPLTADPASEASREQYLSLRQFVAPNVLGAQRTMRGLMQVQAHRDDFQVFRLIQKLSRPPVVASESGTDIL